MASNLKFSEYGAKMHIGKNVECLSRAHSDQVVCYFMAKNTNALKWSFLSLPRILLHSRHVPFLESSHNVSNFHEKEFLQKSHTSDQNNNALFLSCAVVFHEGKRKPAFGISLQASVPTCLPPVMSGTRSPRHQRERSCLKIVFIFNCQPSDFLHIHNTNTTDR